MHDPPKGIAMRGYFRGVTKVGGRIIFSLDEWMLPGYGWIFPLPHGDANVGVGTLSDFKRSSGEPLRALYDRFINDAASPVAGYLRHATAISAPRSWPLDLGPRRRQFAAPGLVVAGEAAGLVGPLTGAGIAFALESGKNAGAAVARSLEASSATATALHSYARHTSRHTLPWLRAEQALQRWLADPKNTAHAVATMNRIPGVGAVGARILLNLG